MSPDTNISPAERLSAVVGGGALLALGLRRGSWDGALMAAFGGSLAWMGWKGYSPMHEALGFNTAGRSGRNTAVPYELGIRVDRSILVRKPAAELYTFWRNFENLQRVMEHVERIEVRDGGQRSRWYVKGPLGHTVEWDAEIVNDVPNRVIGWRTLPGSEVDIAGSVQFRPMANGQSTEVKIELQYNPPAGSVGDWVAKMLGANPRKQIETDLRRFRDLMEKGQLRSSGGKKNQGAAGATTTTKPMWDRNKDVVQQSSEESFPASDPPSWTPETL